jgi:two-component sensor histidine kinase
MVSASFVQPISLAVHELAANAAVHGALSRAGGELSVSWEAEADSLVLLWEEQGVSVPSKPPKHGFGTVLLGAVIERQLGGRVTRNWGDDSLRILISLPRVDGVARGDEEPAVVRILSSNLLARCFI